MDWDEIVAKAFFALLIMFALLVVWGGLYLNNNPSITTGVIVDKFYTPSSTNTGIGIGSDGYPVTVVTTSAAKYTLLLDNNKFYSVGGNAFIAYKVGDRVKITEGFTYVMVELVK